MKFKKGEVKKQFDKSVDIKKAEDDIYVIEGVATVEGVVDKTGEKFAVGAFNEQLGKTVSLMVMHEGLRKIVGSVTLTKNGNNILIKGKLYEDVELARAIAKNKADGVQFNLSIGGKRAEWYWEETDEDMILVTKKALIREVSITGEDQQAHPDAIVTKSIVENEEDEEIEKENKNGGNDMTKKEIEKILEGKMAELEKAKTSEDIKKITEPLNAVVEKLKAGDFDENEEVTKLKSEVSELNETIEKLEDIVQETQKPGSVPENTEKALEEQKEGFNKYLKAFKDSKKEAQEILKAINTGAASGGNLIPQLLADEIVKDIKEASPFLNDAKIYRGSRSDLDLPVRDTWTNNVESVAEGSGVGTKGEVTYSLLQIKAAKLQSEIELTDEMREDTDFDMVGEIREVNQEDFAEEISERIVNGVISTDQQFEGFTTNTDVITAATLTANIGSMTWDDLINLELQVKKLDRKNAKYYVSKDALLKMKTFKDSNDNPLWQQSLIPGQPSTFNGYPVEECPDMDNVEAGNYPVLFGNFGKFYAVYWRKGMETEMDRDASAGKNNHITRARMGGKVRKVTAAALLEIRTS